MRAVLIVASLSVLAAPAYAGLDTRMLVQPNRPSLERQSVADSCRTLTEKTADRLGARFRRLDELPWGLVEHAVLRSVGGCPVREVVYQGRTYWVQPGSGPQIERIDPAIGQTEPTPK